MDKRTESDFLGEKEISNKCYYGIQTLRAKENFYITGVKLSQYTSFVSALAQIKKACVLANFDLGKIPKDISDAISSACDDIINGQYHNQFIVDPIQGGAGTSSNMNANEVITNIALEKMGYEKGRYDIIHPNNHVNMSQSTNDVYPSAIKIALNIKINTLEKSLTLLMNAFHAKTVEFKHIVKIGRTQLQDAVPMTLGQEFHTYQIAIKNKIASLSRIKEDMLKINLGGTAIGTGINADLKYRGLVQEYIEDITGSYFKNNDDLIESTQDTSAFVEMSGMLKRIAIVLSKICNDLRLLSSGPRSGLNEINLPPMQPGSSIMPGKINPVIPEVVNQVAFQVIGADVTISLASEGGQLQLNPFEPIIAYNLFQSMAMLSRAIETLTTKCIDGITANEEECARHTENSISLITAISPLIGYKIASGVAKKALKFNKTIREVLIEDKIFTKSKLDELLDPKRLF
jgi:aspartate ammonia-lyase